MKQYSDTHNKDEKEHAVQISNFPSSMDCIVALAMKSSCKATCAPSAQYLEEVTTDLCDFAWKGMRALSCAVCSWTLSYPATLLWCCVTFQCPKCTSAVMLLLRILYFFPNPKNRTLMFTCDRERGCVVVQSCNNEEKKLKVSLS